MNYELVIRRILAHDEEAILLIPNEESFDFIEYILDNYQNIKDELFHIAWYLRSSKDFIELIREYPNDKQKLIKFIKTNYDKAHNIIKSLLKSNNHNIGYLINNMETIINLDYSYIKLFIDYAIRKKTYYIIDYLMNNQDLEIRGVTITHLIANHYAYYKMKYNDKIKEYLTKDKKKIPERYASLITSFLSVYDQKAYYEMLKFVLENYESNNILGRLTDGSLDYYMGHKDTTNISYYQEQQAIKDIDVLFSSYSGNKYEKYEKYGKYLNPDTRRRYESIERFHKADWKAISDIFSSSLYEKLMDVVEKYASKVTGKIKVAGRGTRATAYQVGDIIIKCSDGKWVQNKTTSISSFLVLKNIEEHYEYDEDGNITQAIEVQPFLKRKVSVFSTGLINRFKEEFANQGYQCQDLLIKNYLTYQNLRYLNDYHEADCDDPELLPDWFKQNPIVLIDSDEVIKRK